MRKFPYTKRGTKLILIFVILFFISCILFVKFNTPAAAEFTDNYLRPIFGNQLVGFLEKTYFNLSDKVQQLTDKSGIGSLPIFFGGGGISSTKAITLTSGLPPVNGEGVWINRPLKLFPNEEVMAYTFVRPDPTRPYAYVTLVQMDMKKMQMDAVAGTKQPGGPAGKPGPGVIPSKIVKGGNLIAAFDGGFQFRDGEYGMIVGDKTYLPLKQDVGTLVGYTDGTLKIVNYMGQDLGPNVAFVRQNCPILVENGEIFALNEKNKRLWGRTFNSDIYTWRSGVGLTSDGNLIYAVGNNLAPITLATALKMAGAQNAIQLDINPFWVRFNIFEANDLGGYKTTPLTKDLKDGSKEYLSSYSKDFFYIYKKS